MGKFNEIQQETTQSYGSNSFTTKITDEAVEFDSAKDSFKFNDPIDVPGITVNGQPLSGGGADWNAKEGEAGYIENRPFYEDVLSEDINVANASEYTEWKQADYFNIRYGRMEKVSKESLIGRNLYALEGTMQIAANSFTDINENLSIINVGGMLDVLVISNGENEYQGVSFKDGLYLFQVELDGDIAGGIVYGQTEIKQIAPKFLTNDSFKINIQGISTDSSAEPGILNNFDDGLNTLDFKIEMSDSTNIISTKYKGIFRFDDDDEDGTLKYSYNGGNEFQSTHFAKLSIESNFEGGNWYFFDADIAAVNASGAVYLVGNIVFTKQE